MRNDSPPSDRPGAEGPDLHALARQGPVHFVGIAGAGMSALAELLLRSGGQVSGCDVRPGERGEALRALGASVFEGHAPEHVEAATAVVATAAVAADHPELAAARRAGIPVLKRAAALGGIVNRGRVVAIAGTHGKTTTTAMTTLILEAAGLDPTGFVGGEVPAWGGGLRPGSERLYAVEADEYDRSFLELRPHVAVLTSIEPDHLDSYGSFEAVEDAFGSFVERVPADGLVAVCSDDDGALRMLRRATRSEALGYGTGVEAGLRAVDVEMHGRGARFGVERDGEPIGEVVLGVTGLHNVRNAMGAIAAALHVGADMSAAEGALARFRGVGRRFQELGEAAGVTVVDDYAHHPTEIRATLAAARSAYAGRRLVAVFQPHLYSRTRDFAREFGEALAAADAVWVTDVYPAREQPIPGVTGELVADAARAAGADPVRFVPERAEVADRLAAALRSGDVVVTMGAGDIDRTARELLDRLDPGAAQPAGAA